MNEAESCLQGTNIIIRMRRFCHQNKLLSTTSSLKEILPLP